MFAGWLAKNQAYAFANIYSFYQLYQHPPNQFKKSAHLHIRIFAHH